MIVREARPEDRPARALIAASEARLKAAGVDRAEVTVAKQL
jgi:hypothetical protein